MTLFKGGFRSHKAVMRVWAQMVRGSSEGKRSFGVMEGVFVEPYFKIRYSVSEQAEQRFYDLRGRYDFLPKIPPAQE